MQNWIGSMWLAEIHRETYVAMLQSWIPHGERGEFARKVGISREYLSYLCALDSPEEARPRIKRLPSPERARRIAAALKAPSEVQESLIENMELAHVSASEAYYGVKEFVESRRVVEALAQLEKTHRQATFGTKLGDVRRNYRVFREASAQLLRALPMRLYPASFVQAALYLHDAQCVLDRADDALRWAKLAGLSWTIRTSLSPS